ncbi:MAG: uL22 family ribosomal protein [Candidatus Aenigmatarchaeota archaeon]
MKIAIARTRNSRISLKHAITISKFLKGKKLERAKKFLENVLMQKESYDGKYYTNATKEFISLLKAAEANAKKKGLNLEKLFIKVIKADKGETMYLPKRAKFVPRRAKTTHLTVILEER